MRWTGRNTCHLATQRHPRLLLSKNCVRLTDECSSHRKRCVCRSRDSRLRKMQAALRFTNMSPPTAPRRDTHFPGVSKRYGWAMRRGPSDIQRAVAVGALVCLLATMPEAARAANVAADCNLHIGARDIKLSAFRGNVVYVDFWASWCTTCVLSFPFLDQLNRTYAAQGLTVVGVGMDEKADDAQRFLARHPVTFNIALNGNAQCARDFGVSAMPSSFVLDRNGVVRHAHQGFRLGDADQLRMVVEKLLAETGAH